MIGLCKARDRMEADVTILSELPPRVTSTDVLDVWRSAHKLCVDHLIAASWSECGCTAQSLCPDGQVLEDTVEDAERALGFAHREAAFALSDEIAEGLVS